MKPAQAATETSIAKNANMPASHKIKATDEDFFSATLDESDPEIAQAIKLELGRQRDDIELIAST